MNALKRALTLAALSCNFLLVNPLHASPSGEEVKAGEATFCRDGKNLSITTSDKAIIEYQKFNVGKGESVEFIQPSARSTVLNRVVGGEESKILGDLKGNGRIFLVNPEGIYFGPNARVNAGSFLATSLSIRDEDFLADRFEFCLDKGVTGSVINEGVIQAVDFVALFAPVVSNRGTIYAKVEKVFIGAAEKVAIDLMGDGLIHFRVDGELEKALIENYGKIEAANGAVQMSAFVARKAIQSVLNTEGIEVATGIEESNGVIRLVSGSSIRAKEVEVIGDRVDLRGATIDASGDEGGGRVLIGGDYQGLGGKRNAEWVIMDEASTIYADAKQSGDGGRVILWADNTTLFDGNIYVRGGSESGNGGFVETSGKENLGIETGCVNACAPNGRAGDWLLDPSAIVIATGGGGTIGQASSPNCGTTGTVTIAPSAFLSAGANVILCSQRNTTSTIAVNNNLTMQSGFSLTMNAGSTNLGTITLNANITTIGQPITLNGLVTVGAAVTLDTTNAGGSTAGANISFSNTINGAQTLALNSGTGGTVTMTGAVGGTTPLTSLTVTNSGTITQSSTVKTTGLISYTAQNAINLNGNMTTSGGAINLAGPVTLAGAPVLDSTNAGATAAGANITLGGSVNGATTLALRAGTAGNATLSGAVGGSTPLTNLTFTSANLIQIGGNITVTGANPLTFPSAVSLTGSSTITSNNATIGFSSTVNGGAALVIAGGSATTTFTGAVGGTTPLSSLGVTSATITQTSTAKTTGALSYTGSTAINVNGAITTVGGAINLSGPLAITTAPIFDTTNGGAAPAGAGITLSNSVNGATTLTLLGGTAGTVTMTGAVGGTTPLTSLTVSGSTITQSSTAKTTGAISYTAPTLINVGGNMTTSGATIGFTGPVAITNTPTLDSTNAGGTAAGAGISFSSTLNGFTALTLRAGSSGVVTFSGAVGGTSALSNLIFTSAASVQVGSNITVTGANTLTFPVPVALTGGSTITSNSANIGFGSTLNGGAALVIAGGTGVTSFTGIVGGVTPLTSLNVTAATITQSANASVVDALTYTGVTAINLNGNVTSTTPSALTFTGPLALTSDVIATGSNITLSSTVNGAKSLTLTATGTVALSGAVGGSAPLTNLVFTSPALIQIGGNITVTGANPLTFPSAVGLTGTSTITSNNANIGFSNTLNGAFALTVAGGTGATTFTGAVGGTTPLSALAVTAATITQSSTAQTTGSLSYTGSTLINLANNLTTSSAAIGLTGPVSLTGAVTATGSTINFSSTINGAQTLVLSGSSAITLSGAVGGSSALTSLTASGTTITQNSTVKTTGVISYTGSTLISVNGNITTSGNTIGMTGPVTVSSSPTFDSTNGSLSAGGANISFSSTLNGATALTLRAGTGGTVLFSGAVGGVAPLSNLIFTSANLIQLASNITVTGANPLSFSAPVSLTGASTITSNSGNITFGNTLNGAQILNLVGGTAAITFNGVVGSTPLTSLTVSAGTINQNAAVTTSNAISYSGSTMINLGGNLTTSNSAIGLTGAVSLSANSVISGSNITLSSTLNGAQAMTLSATGSVTMTGIVGGVTPLSALTVNAATINQGAAVITAGAISYTGLINLSGNLTTTSSAIGLTGAVTLLTDVVATGSNITYSSTINGAQNLTLTGSGTVLMTGAVGGSTALTSLTVSGSTVTQGSTSKASGLISYTAPTAINLGGNVTTGGSAISMTGPVTLQADVTVDPTNGNIAPAGAAISFSSTVNGSGSRALLLSGGNSGAITMTGAVGNTTALTTLTVTGSSITQISSARAVGAITYTTTAGISLGGNVTSTTPSPISLTGALSLTGDVIINGSTLLCSSTINGAKNLTLTGSGTVAMTGSVGGATPLTSLTVTGSAITQSSTVRTTGAISYNATTINLNGSVTTTASAIGMTGAVSLGADITATGSTISFSSTINGAQSLTLTGSGAVTLSGAVGGSTPLSQLTVSGTTLTQSNAVTTTGAIGYNGSAISLNGNLMTTASAIGLTGPVSLLADVTAVGSNITLSSTVTGAHNLTLTGSNIVTISGAVTSLTALTLNGNTIIQGSSVATSGPINYTAPSLITLGGNVNGAATPVSMTGPVSLNADVVMTGSNITLSSTVDGARALTLTGSGSVTITGVVGGTTALTSLTASGATLTQGNAVRTTGAINYTGAMSLTGNLTTSSSAIALNGAVSLQSNVAMSGSTISFSNTINGARVLTLTGSGAVSMSGAIGAVVPLTSLAVAGSTITQSSTAVTTGSVSYTGAISLGGAVTTSGSAIGFTGALSLLADAVLTGSNITLSSTVDGARALTLTGSGVVALGGAIGGVTPLTSLTASGGAITQAGAISTTGAVAFTGAISLGGSITTVNNNITLTGNVTRTQINNVTLSTGSGAGDVLFTGTLNGDVTGRNLILSAGSGNITLQGTMGGVVPFNDFTVTGANITLANRGTGSSLSSGITTVTASAAINFTGTVIADGTQIYQAQTNFNFTAGSPVTVTSGGESISFITGVIALVAGSDFTVNSNGGNITLSDLTGLNRNITINAATGSVNLAQIGASGSNVQSVIVTGSTINHPDPIFSNTTPQFNSPSVITISTNQSGSAVYASPVIIAADNLIFSGGAFTFNSTLNADSSSNSRNLTINPGLGNSVTFTGLVGNVAPLTSLTIGSAQNVTFNSGVNLGSFTQTGGAGTTLFASGLATTAAAGVNISAAAVTLMGSISTSSGAFIVNNSGAFTSSNTSYSLAGSFQQTGSGSTTLIGGNIQTADSLVSFAGPVSLTTDFTINTVASSGAPITFSNTVNGAYLFELRGSAITLAGAVGGVTPLTSLTVQGTTITQGSAVTTTGAINYTGSMSLSGNLTTSGSAVSLSGAVVLGGDVVVTGSNITLSSSLSGARACSLMGSNLVTISGAVSGLTSLTVTGNAFIQGSSVQSTGAISYNAAAISLGGNLTTTSSPIAVTGAVSLTGGVVATGSTIAFSSTINGSQALTLTGSGAVTMGGAVGGVASLSSLTVSGSAITQSAPVTVIDTISYTGAISVNGNLTTNGGSISMAGAVALASGITIDSTNLGGSLAGGNVTFSSTINGSQNLTVACGMANILFTGAVGQNTPLNALTISSANNITADAIKAASYNQAAGTGTTTLNGAMVLSGASGFVFTGNNLTVNNTLSTALAGPATIIVGGTFRLGSGGALSLDGPFSQTGAGMTQSSGSITTTNDQIQFGGALVLFGNTSLSTGGGAGNIIFSSTVSGPGGLTLTAGAGNINFTAAVGGATRLGDLTVVSVANLTAQAITATTITQLAGSGTSTFNGTLNTNGAGGIHKTGTNFIRNGSVVTTNNGPLVVNNSGSLNAATGSIAIISGPYSQIGSGAVTIGSSITATGISFAAPVTMNASFALNSNNGNILFSNTLNATTAGVEALTLTAGTGNITLSAAVGGTTRVGTLTINSCANMTTAALSASSISINSSGGTVTFGGDINTNAAAGITLNVTNLFRGGAIIATNGGALTAQFTGTITGGSPTPIQVGSLYTTNLGSNPLNFQGSVITDTGGITYDTALNLVGTSTFNTSASGGNIIFNFPINGAQNLNLNAGMGNITLAGAIGGTTRLGDVTITSVNNFTAAAITASTFTQVSGTGTSTFNGNLNTNGAGGIHKTGVNFVRNGSLTTTNGGPLVVNNSGSLSVIVGAGTSVSGSYSQTGSGAVSIGGSIAAAGISFAGPLTLNANLSLNSNNGNIVFSNSVNATTSGVETLTFTAGTGDITVSTAAGGITRLGVVTVNSSANISTGALSAASINIIGSTGTTTFGGNINTNAPAGVVLNVHNFVRGGGITATNGGPLVGNFSGIASGTSPTPIIVGSLTVVSPGSINGGGTVITNTGGITYNAQVNLIADISWDTSQSGGNITFNSTLNGAKNLSLNAGAGTIQFNGSVGATTPVLAISITSATNITSGSIRAASITTSGITGIASFGGALTTTGVSGISISADQITFASNVTTTGSGPVNIVLTGTNPLTIANGALFSLDGSFSQTGAGAVSTGGSITTTNDTITFVSPITLTANISLNSGSGGGNINLAGINGAQALTLAAGVGNISFSDAIGSLTPLTSLTISSGNDLTLNNFSALSSSYSSTVTGLTTIAQGISCSAVGGITIQTATLALNGSLATSSNGPISIINTAAGSITGAITSSGAFSQSGGGALTLGSNVSSSSSLQFSSALTLSGPVFLTTSGGALNLNGAVNGNFDLSLTAGSGSLILSNAIGAITPLNGFFIVSAGNATIGALTVSNIVESMSSGLTHFTGALSALGSSGISLTGSQFQFDGNITTGSGGPITITHTGNLSFAAGATIVADGPFTEIGGVSVSMGSNLSTTGDSISWASPINLTNNVTMSTGGGGGDILFSNTVNGPYCLTLSTGTGNIQFSGVLGGVVPLNCLSAAAPTIVQSAAITTATTVLLTGALSLGANITTTNSNITVTGNITRTTTNNITLSTGSGAGNITITGTINGNAQGRNLTLSTGTGDVTLQGVIGGSSPLTTLSIAGANATIGNFGSTPSSTSGNLTINVTDSINFTGTTYTGNAQSYTAGGYFNYMGGALTTLTSGGGAITFSTGTIALSPNTDFTVNSNGGAITLSDLTGPGLNITLDAFTGVVNLAKIATSTADEVNSVTITAASYNAPDPIFSTIPLSFQSPTFTTLSGTIPPGSVTYNSPVLIAGNTSFSAGDFIFNSSVNGDGGGPWNVTINPGSGNSVTFAGLVGNSSPLATLTIGSAQDVSIGNSMIVGSFSQTGGAGTTTISGGINANNGGISIHTANISINEAVFTTNNAATTLDNSGTLTITGATFDLDGLFQQTGAGAVSIGGSIQTTDDTVSFTAPVSLNANLAINTVSSTGANITFSNTVNQAHNLDLTAGGGNITFASPVGGVARVGSVIIESAADVSAVAVTAAALSQVSGTGTTTFGGVIDINTTSGIHLAGNAFTFNNNVTTSASGPIVIANTGALTLGSTVTMNASGAFTQSGSGPVMLGGNINAAAAISFAGVVAVTNPTLLNTSTNGTSITFSSAVNGPSSLELNLGNSGALLFSAPMGAGAPLSAFTIDNAGNVTTQAITAATITQAAGSGTAVFGSLNTSAVGGIHLTGSAFTINGNLVTAALGPVAIVNSGTLTLAAGSSTAITGPFTQSGGGNVTLSGSLVTVNQPITFTSPVTLGGTATVSSGSGGGDVTFNNSINGSQNLTVAAGTGNLLFSNNIGLLSRLNTLTVQSAANITYQQVQASAIVQSASSGITLIAGALNALGSGGISLTGATITQNGTLNTSTGGAITIVNSGTFTQGASIFADGGFAQSGSGAVILNGSITTTSDLISIAGAVTLTGATTLSSGGAGAGNINLAGGVNGGSNLTLTAGTGNITLGGAIGGTSRIGVLTINSVTTATIGDVRATSISQAGGSGTTTFGGTINTNGVAGINLTGSGFTINGTVSTTTGSTGGGITINNTGVLTFGAAADLQVMGAFVQVGTGTVSLRGNLATGGAVSFTGTVNIVSSGSASVDSSFHNNGIQFFSPVNGPGALSCTLGSGNLSFSADVGASSALSSFTINSAGSVFAEDITAGSITQTAGSVLTTFNGDLTANSGSLTLTGNAITFVGNANVSGAISITQSGTLTTALDKTITSGGTFTQSGGGGVSLAGTIHAIDQNITFTNPITLTGPTTLNSDGGGDILILSTIDGSFDLVYNAGTGNIILAAAIGGTVPVLSLTITEATDVSAQAISAGSITQSVGMGTTAFAGALTTTDPIGINLTGKIFTFNAPVTTTGNGPLIIHNSGLLTLSSAALIDLSGSFDQTGSASTSLATSILSEGSQILFTGPITLVGDSLLDMNGLGGTITLLGAVNGANDLLLDGDAGSIFLLSAVGGSTALASFQVVSCANFTSKAISASTITLEGVTALATCNGPLVTAGASGITLSGAAFTLNGNITTSGGGKLSIANAALATIAPTSTISLSGPFMQIGSGTTNIGGSLTTAGSDISFVGPMQLTGNLSLQSGNGDIALGSGLEGSYSLSITAGAGNVTAPTTISTAIPLINFTVLSANNIILQGIGSVILPMSGTISLTASNVISLHNTTYASHDQYYMSGGDLDFMNPGLVQLFTSGGSISFASAIARCNNGTDLLINTNGGNFTFNTLQGTSGENVTINTGSGLASLGIISNIGSINSVTITAGSIILNGTMQHVNLSLTSNNSILNGGAAQQITSTNSTFFNAIHGNVGSLASPILVVTLQQIIAGGTDLAAFNGSSIDDTVNVYAPNPPCVIYFNGIKIKDCGTPPPPPTPTPNGSSSSSSAFRGSPLFAVVGVYDSQFTLADDYFFFTYFLDDRFLHRALPVFYRAEEPLPYAINIEPVIEEVLPHMEEASPQEEGEIQDLPEVALPSEIEISKDFLSFHYQRFERLRSELSQS